MSNKLHNSAYLNMDLLRFTTAGSVDDGKSTLIGRLLYDSKSIFDDQVEDLERISERTGDQFNLALLTDGLKAEREQGITIDVAYRYFATPKRKFIIADTPGHLQYTRNMVTGASTADLAIILIDARQGVVEQTRRHTFIAKLLGIAHIVVCINKMDLVDYDEAVYKRIISDFKAVELELSRSQVTFIPISALHGDNVVSESEKTQWYHGRSLLHYLENVNVNEADENEAFILPVQGVVGRNGSTGYTGRIASGSISVGDKLKILPQKQIQEVKSLGLFGKTSKKAYRDESVTLGFASQVTASRGDLIVDASLDLQYVTALTLDVCWLQEAPLNKQKNYIYASATGEFEARITHVQDKLNFWDLTRQRDVDCIGVNDIATIHIHLDESVPQVAYAKNKVLGSAILIDPDSNATVAAGMIRINH